MNLSVSEIPSIEESIYGEPVLSFTVLGDAKPAGSKRAFNHPKTGRPIVTDANKAAAPWKREVRAAGLEAIDAVSRRMFTGHLAVEMIFYRVRPAGHYGSGRNRHLLRPSAPRWPGTRPDALKLARGCEDALEGVVYRDDAQIVDELLFKRYGEPARVEIRIWELKP